MRHGGFGVTVIEWDATMTCDVRMSGETRRSDGCYDMALMMGLGLIRTDAQIVQTNVHVF
jgi:hypothetical protein